MHIPKWFPTISRLKQNQSHRISKSVYSFALGMNKVINTSRENNQNNEPRKAYKNNFKQFQILNTKSAKTIYNSLKAEV